MELIPLPLLRKYIIYARSHIHPKLDVDDGRISKLYSDLRKEADVRELGNILNGEKLLQSTFV